MTSIGYVFGFIGAGLTLASYMMKSMLPLRLVALSANVFFVLYGWLEMALPSLFLYAIMIPVNGKKAWEVRKLIRAIEGTRVDAPVADWLLPHMHRREVPAGQVLWRQGDQADEMLYLSAGTLRLVEHDEVLGPGSLVGEIGLFAPGNRRTLTLRTETACTLYALSAEGVAELYYKHPKLGFHVMRLVVARLMHDAEVARAARDAAASGPAAAT